MAMEHHPDCDQLHTPRQPCNDALAGWPEAASVKANASNGASDDIADIGAEPDDALARPAISTQEMPAPSPRVLRAWEDTAAAVGATATPAPPPHPIVEAELAERRGWFAGHAGLVAVVAVAAFAVLIVARRRS